jgi:hypothetical protein
MIMVKAYKPREFFLLYNNVLVLEGTLLLIVHRILTNIVYDHSSLMLSCLYILLSTYYLGNKLSIYA